MKKKVFISGILLLIFVAFFIVLNRASAGTPGDPTTWEVKNWPDLPGGVMSPTNPAWPADQKLTLGYMFTYLFTFALLIVGIVALLMLIINVVRYMISTAIPATKVDAAEKIRNVGLGVLLLMGAYIFLITINPELVLFGMEEAEAPSLVGAFGSITLYNSPNGANCNEADPQIELYDDNTLGDNPGWEDEADSFKITNGLIARICSNRDYTDCEIYIGGDPTDGHPEDADGNTCVDAAAEGFTPGAPAGITSVKGEGTVDFVRLILFPAANCEGDSQVFSDSLQCKAVEGQQWEGNSYWLLQDTVSSVPPLDYEAILCDERNWNDCSNEIGPGSANTCNNRADITSVCVYEENSPESCVGAFLENGSRDFVPYLHTSCKNLSSGGLAKDYEMVGDNCRVTLNEGTDCDSTDSITSKGDNGDTGSAGDGNSALGGVIGF